MHTGPAVNAGPRPLLRIENLTRHFPIMQGVFRRQVGTVKAVDGLDFEIPEGETLGLVGESGCGKSTTGRVILRLHPATAGRIEFGGEDITALEGEALRRLRRRMQDDLPGPAGQPEPRMTAGGIVGEPLREHGTARGKALAERWRRCSSRWASTPVSPPLPARVLRRPAPAHRGGPRPGPRPRVHRLRRADRRPRRLDPGPGGEPAGGPPGASRAHVPVHLARPRMIRHIRGFGWR